MSANVIIIAVIVAAVVVVAYNYVRRGGHGDCCGDVTGPVRVRHPADADASHYDHEYTVQVTGMSCDGCAKVVANAFNSQDGYLAEVSLADGSATVRTKQPVSADELRRVVRNAGYGVGTITGA